MSIRVKFPFSYREIMGQKRTLVKDLLDSQQLVEKRIAVLGGSTTAEVLGFLELFLLSRGIQPKFYESQYNRYFEEVAFDNPKLREFAPELIYIHTTSRNLPDSSSETLADDVLERFQAIWEGASSRYGCPVVQNNFEMPATRVLGNLDGVDARGLTKAVLDLNQAFAFEAAKRTDLHIHDIHYLSARLGLDHWYDSYSWHGFQYALNMKLIPEFAYHLASLMLSIFSKSKKCLVVDLDNTLWGGIIGEDGLEGIQIGPETPQGEVYYQFQKYVLELKARGVVLAIASKNDLSNVKLGFSHPDCLLSLDDFACIRANWESKADNIAQIASELNLSEDALVFVDDSVHEREEVAARLPEVAVPDMGKDPSRYLQILDQALYFEIRSLTEDDLNRARSYQDNAKRLSKQSEFASLQDYLESLNMVAKIQSFQGESLERVCQLINKTNQFNLTTQRMTLQEVQEWAESSDRVCLETRLSDDFGDSGLVSAMLCEIDKDCCLIENWVMSCRVFERGLEFAIFDILVETLSNQGCDWIQGTWVDSGKNSYVKDLFFKLGFTEKAEGSVSHWEYRIPEEYAKKNQHIRVEESVAART